MKIDRALNLTFPVETEAGTVYVHSTPIGRDIFHQYFDLIAETVSKMHARGMAVISGPNVAALMLRKVAEDAGRWDGEDGVANGLMAEIRRLTSVVVSSADGWKSIPYQEALKRRMFDDATTDAIEGAIVFFTCSSVLHAWERERLLAALTISGMLSIWRAQLTSSNSSEFAASLPTSSATGSSGATETTSSATS